MDDKNDALGQHPEMQKAVAKSARKRKPKGRGKGASTNVVGRDLLVRVSLVDTPYKAEVVGILHGSGGKQLVIHILAPADDVDNIWNVPPAGKTMICNKPQVSLLPFEEYQGISPEDYQRLEDFFNGKTTELSLDKKPV